MNIGVTGGRVNCTKLTSELGDRDYDLMKVGTWRDMLRRDMRPKKWYKRRKEGTKVSFDMIQSNEDALRAIKELQDYLTEVNLKHGTDLHVVFDK